jgi:4'-phosphopantetheinyl transferase EntD
MVVNQRDAANLMLASPFNENIAFACLRLGDQVNYTLPREEALILSPRASVKRRTEFTLGRAAANLAVKQLGFESPHPVLKGERGEPLWPEGIVGSITHCGCWAIAAVAVSSVVLSIGIDLENPDQIQTDDIAGLVCHDTECRWAMEDRHYGNRFVMLFSAKEAAYKALYPLCRRFIDFKEVRLRWIPERQQFRGELLTGLNPTFTQGFEFDVGCKFSRDLILTHMVLGS